MGHADYLAEGDYNALCFECQKKFKASELKKTWQNYYACYRCWRPRQPQDFVRGIPDMQPVPWSQSQPQDTFVYMCTPQGISAIPGEIQPGCVIPGYISPSYIDDYFTP